MITDFMQQEFRSQNIRQLLNWLENSTGLTFTETSSYRVPDDDDIHGVHNVIPCRGCDLRMRSKPIGEVIVAHINRHWIYDPSRPSKRCALLHGEGANLHIHIQTHPNTKFISKPSV